MAPQKRTPLNVSESEGQLLITAFEGAITTRVLDPPEGRAFAFEVVFELDHPRLLELSQQKPPLHFHPQQKEYFEVLEGHLCVEADGKARILSEDDGEICVTPWTHHRLYPPPLERHRSGVTGQRTVFLLSGSEPRSLFKLDLVFFENWYAYQDEVVVRGARVDFFQMFDAGGSYLSFPPWVPFGRYLSVITGIAVGRWLGGLFGYQPFYREWTTDWQTACEKMEKSIFQRRFASPRHHD